MGGETKALADKGWLYHPDYPDHWERCPLYSLAQWVNGLAFRDVQFSPFGMPVIKIAEIKGGISGQTKFTQQTFDESVRVRPGDLLFSWSGQPDTSIDAFWWRGPEGWLNQHVFRVTPANGVDPTFFYYLLRYLKPNFVGIARNKQTTGLGHVTKRDLENIEAAYPDLPEQRAIAHILGTLDDKIELNRRRNQTLEAMARALFKDWFVDFGPVRAKMEGREPYLPADLWQLFPDRLDDEGKPEGWEEVAAEMIADIGIGKTPPRKESQWFSTSDSDVRWVSIRGMGNSGVFLQRTSEFLTSEAIKKFNIRVVPDNTVILSFKLTVGRVAITDGGMVTNEAIAHLKIKCEIGLSSEYLYSYLREFDYGRLGSTSSIATAVNSKGIKALPVLIPANNLSVHFTALVAPIFAHIKHLQSEAEILAQVRDTLLPKLISGEIRVADANDYSMEILV
ncbi:restriction endonuclease subunit S [Acidithiobacillus sp. M4-SHS-6]|uniref:restriction endonuclease subunit S n=1 Tax=Acidithiobacillus sp. M4-SHS-6 TaxID=3383024 RepID=UPI0039BECE20